MKTAAVLTLTFVACVGPATVFASDPAPPTYIVTRASTAEARALLSARLLKLNAAKLRWYDEVNVVRADLPKEALPAVRADPDVVLAFPEQEMAEPIVIAQPAAPPLMSQPMPTAPTLAPQLPFTGMPPITPPPLMTPLMTAGPTGLIDFLADRITNRIFNRAPSCKILLSQTAALFEEAGGDQVIQVKASGSCSWQAQPSVPWIKIMSGAGVSGSGVVAYTVTPTAGKPRTGSISVICAAGGSPIKGAATVIVMQTVH